MRQFLRKLISTLYYPFLAGREVGSIRVLTYHRVNEVSPADRLSVKTSEFQKQMAHLHRRGYRTLSPEALSEALKSGILPEKSVFITFDDGYRDNFTDAFPILKNFDFRATVFVATELVGKERDGHRMLSWDEIREMAGGGVSFGSHTVHHARMNRIPDQEKQKEAEDSRHALEEVLQKKVTAFCYPYGDTDSGATQAAASAGYGLAFTTRPGPVRAHSDRFLLPRTEISGFDSLFDFKKKLAGAFDRLHEMVQQRQGRRVSVAEPIPVLYVIWSLGLGGAEQVVAALAKRLDRKCFRPLVACLNEAGPFSDLLEKEGIPVIPLHKKGKWDFSMIPKLMRLIKAHRVQVVHTHLWGGSVWGRIAARLAGVRVIVATEHSYSGKPALYYWIERILALWTDRIVVVSEKVKEFYTKTLRIRPDKLSLIYNGVDPAAFRAERQNGFRKELGVEPEASLVGIVGRLVPVKAHEVLFDAVTRLKESHPTLQVAVIGDGERRAELEAWCRSRSLEKRIRFLGLRKDVARLLPDLDLLVLSSDREGLSMTVLEAMAAALPVVATGVGGTPELVLEGETGFLVPPRDPIQLADRIDRLLRDKALSRRMGEAGRKRVQENFSLEKMTAATEQLYTQLLQAKEML
ncbi:MAG: glycosyltransferase [Candidatus Omnitrophota bacterium]